MQPFRAPLPLRSLPLLAALLAALLTSLPVTPWLGSSAAAQTPCEIEWKGQPVFEIRENFGMNALGDYDRDGHLDLTTGSFIFPGKGDGTFGEGRALESVDGGFDARSADFDGDGLLDLAVIGIGAQTISMYWGRNNDGGGDYLHRQIITINPAVAVALWHMDLGEFNGDGRPDLVLISIGGPQHAILINDGNRGFTMSTLQTDQFNGHMLTTGDFDGDDHDDVAVGSGNQISLFFGKGDGTFHPAKKGMLQLSTGDSGGGHRFKSADLDLDGKDELLATLGQGRIPSDSPSEVLIYLGQNLASSASFPEEPDLTLSLGGGLVIRFIEPLDFNLDGVMDIVALGETSGGSRLRSFTGRLEDGVISYAPGTTFQSGLSPSRSSVLGQGDVNEDGFPDLVVTTEDTSRARIFLASCPGVLAARGDVNLDLALDVSDPIAMLSFLFLGIPLQCQAAGEVNGDGTFDLTDAIYLLAHLFSGGEPPVGEPQVTCGPAE